MGVLHPDWAQESPQPSPPVENFAPFPVVASQITTNFEVLQQHTLIATESVGQEPGCSVTESPAAIEASARAVFPSGGMTGEESTPTFTPVIGRIYFPEVVRMRALASCRLLAGGCPRLVDATVSSLSCRLPRVVTYFIRPPRRLCAVFHIM